MLEQFYSIKLTLNNRSSSSNLNLGKGISYNNTPNNVSYNNYSNY